MARTMNTDLHQMPLNETRSNFIKHETSRPVESQDQEGHGPMHFKKGDHPVDRNLLCKTPFMPVAAPLKEKEAQWGSLPSSPEPVGERFFYGRPDRTAPSLADKEDPQNLSLETEAPFENQTLQDPLLRDRSDSDFFSDDVGSSLSRADNEDQYTYRNEQDHGSAPRSPQEALDSRGVSESSGSRTEGSHEDPYSLQEVPQRCHAVQSNAALYRRRLENTSEFKNAEVLIRQTAITSSHFDPPCLHFLQEQDLQGDRVASFLLNKVYYKDLSPAMAYTEYHLFTQGCGAPAAQFLFRRDLPGRSTEYNGDFPPPRELYERASRALPSVWPGRQDDKGSLEGQLWPHMQTIGVILKHRMNEMISWGSEKLGGIVQAIKQQRSRESSRLEKQLSVAISGFPWRYQQSLDPIGYAQGVSACTDTAIKIMGKHLAVQVDIPPR